MKTPDDMSNVNSLEYINDFLYFVFMPYKNRGDDTLLYCSGINLDRFLPVTKGRHRPLANPARRGLQLANLGVRALALKKGSVPKSLNSQDCAEVVPKSDGWYRDKLLIEHVHISLPRNILDYVVLNFLGRVMNSCQLHEKLPDRLPNPADLQSYLESLCDKYRSDIT
jgi:hypothetical protein